ncbi:ankyrin [Thecamonas trahens ATCC 50062]|uniref:Ankyrin n=1 Tax=Thecamonas trahens ATCC 50062 TaxID=461836 RepID=A0A0L0DBM6_THETB|nr:ankyrin [Thecamonas trahens ATCC 50062]KNC49630.1 ankyrin [Thecamonas trahens ATCC 50062]|eukprot:XP_013757735.1 ankyrin [Thecamonas trahens ATCC 50062]
MGDEDSYELSYDFESYAEEDDIDDPLILAASCGDMASVQELLDRGHPVDVEQTTYALTPLLAACQHGHTNCARLLLAAGATMTEANTVGGKTSALYFAVDSRRVTLVQLLLKRGVDLNSRNGPRKITPLFLAVMKEARDMVNVLLAAGANPNVATSDKLALPLNQAAKSGSLDIVAQLLQAGASLDVETSTGHSPLFLAVDAGHTDVVALILEEGANPQARVNQKNGPAMLTALHAASGNGDLEIVQMLLAAGAEADPVSARAHFTPLHNAARRGHADVVIELLDAGANVGALTKGETTVLFSAVKFAQRKVAKILIDANAHINARNGERRVTALYIAACQGYVDLCADLITAGALVNAVCSDTYSTPFNAAVRNGHTEVAKLLLQHDVDISIPNINGYSSLYIAAEFDRCDILKELLARGMSPNQACGRGKFSPIYIACKRGHLYCAELLIRAGADINVASKHKHLTSLTGACRGGRHDIVQLLFEHGVDHAIRTEKGFTSLFVAAEFGHKHVVKFLIENGAPVDDANGPDNLTALYIAAEKGHFLVARVLLEAGADPNLATSHETPTPLLAALHFQRTNLVTELLKWGASPKTRTATGLSVLYVAVATNQAEIVAALLAAAPLDDLGINEVSGATPPASGEAAANPLPETPLLRAVTDGNDAIVDLLLDNGADANVAAAGVAPLAKAAAAGFVYIATQLVAKGADVTLIELLLTNGADVNAKNDRGATPLFLACLEADAAAVQVLLAADADPNIGTARDYYPLFCAAEYEAVPIVGQLIAAGANVNQPNGKHAITALFVASQIGSLAIVDALTAAGAEPFEHGTVTVTEDEAFASGDDSGIGDLE